MNLQELTLTELNNLSNEIRKELSLRQAKRIDKKDADKLVAFISEKLQFDIKDIGRHEPLVSSRMVLFLYMRDQMRMTYQKIGKVLNRDHSTVMWGYKTAKNRLETNDGTYMVWHNKVTELIKEFKG